MSVKSISLPDQAWHVLALETAVNNMAQGLCMFDAEQRLAFCNDVYVRLFDLPPRLTAQGTKHDDIVAYRVAHGMKQIGTLQSFMERHKNFVSSPTAGAVLVELESGRLVSIRHQPLASGGWVSTHLDVTDDLARVVALEGREQQLRLQNMRFEAAVNNMTQGLCMFDAERRLVVCNGPYAELYRIPKELTRPGTPFSDILAYRLAHGVVPLGGQESYVENRNTLLRTRGVARDHIAMQDGRIISITHHPMGDGGWVATHEDVTEQQKHQDRIHHLARHDGLTGLPNRVFFAEEIKKVELRIARGEQWSLLYLDLDRFKPVNDTLGHAVGDSLLREVAGRLSALKRDDEMVVRLGGDEFAFLIGPLSAERQPSAVAQQVIEAISERFTLDGHDISINTSIGIAVAPADGMDGTVLMRNADLALYRAKSDGGGSYQFFEQSMNAALQERRFLETGIRAALTLNQFRLVYQPLVDLEDNTICCFEALLRWDHPIRGDIPPMTFIPVAEETGAIIPIGEWVLREACLTATAWPDNVRVAVNLSPAQFKSPHLAARVASALVESGLPGRRLELEITESLLLNDTDLTLKTLNAIHNLGVRISLDDFGTGYSSLSYLRSFPFDKIKIDRSFIGDLMANPESHAIIHAVIGLGHSLGMSTTAEGIETQEQLDIVRAQGCREVQGFLFSPPLPASGATELLKAFGKGAFAKPLHRSKKAAK